MPTPPMAKRRRASDLTERTGRLMRERLPFLRERTVIVGVSGGADSLALLHILNALRPDLGFSIHAATLDHGLRGQASADDAAFVEAAAAAWGIACTRGYTDTAARAAAEKMSIETTARRARYAFFAQVAAETGAAAVAVAHHADDQAETILMHLIRGAGLRGLAGMTLDAPLPYAPDSPCRLIRPLLDITRGEIDQYVHAHGLTPRRDATNDDLDYERNRIRHHLIPTLRTYNPQIGTALAQLARIAGEEDRFLDELLHAQTALHLEQPEGQVRIDRVVFLRLPPVLQRRLVRRMVSMLKGDDAPDLSWAQVERARAIVETGRTGTTALLSGRIRLQLAYDHLIAQVDDTDPFSALPLMQPGTVIAVRREGITAFGEGWELHAVPTSDDAMCTLSIPAGAALTLRTRRTGEVFQPLGMGGHHKKLSAWMIDQRIPSGVRDRVPLLCVNDQAAAVVWGHQWRIDGSFARPSIEPTSTQRSAVVHFRVHQRKIHEKLGM
ncbi:MAG: tRNA lysidine(34) synthetase TilS [bacterium]|nr:tRNA lysidine(34) synthetase TilS [bacterium]